MKFTDILDEYHIPYKRHGESPQVTQGWIGCFSSFSLGAFFLFFGYE